MDDILAKKHELFRQIKKVVSFDGIRNEAQNKYNKHKVTDVSSAQGERFVFIMDVWMLQSQKVDEYGPHKPANPEKNSHKDKNANNIGRKPSGFLPHQGIDNMPTIKLSHRKKIQGCHKHSHPSCKGNRMRDHIKSFRNALENHASHYSEYKRLAENKTFVSWKRGDQFRKRKTIDDSWEGKDKTC